MLPCCCCIFFRKRSLYVLPCVFVVESAIFIYPILQAVTVADELELHMEKATPPTWLADCVEQNAQIDGSVVAVAHDELQTVISEIRALVIVMTIVGCLTALLIVSAPVALFLFIFNKAFRAGNADKAEQQSGQQ